MKQVAAYIEYALEHNISKYQDWKFKGCENTVLPEDILHFKVMGSVASLTLKKACFYLQKNILLRSYTCLPTLRIV